MSSSCLIMRSSLVAKTAADNSIRGIIIALRGASLDFAMIREQWTSPRISVWQRYETAP